MTPQPVYMIEWKDGCFSFFNNTHAIKGLKQDLIRKVFRIPISLTVEEIFGYLLNRYDESVIYELKLEELGDDYA
jgi:hypothetical protein